MRRCLSYAFAPNSLSFCGPPKKSDILHYSQSGEITRGTKELLSDFKTLYPYLQFIAGEHRIPDPFDERVVEAYWIGNTLLDSIAKKKYIAHLDHDHNMSFVIDKAGYEQVANAIVDGGMPLHAFHVLSFWRRTGHHAAPHTIESMDACMIHWGKIVSIGPQFLTVDTQQLKLLGNKLMLINNVKRTIKTTTIDLSKMKSKLSVGMHISYHWGEFCEVLDLKRVRQLHFYTTKTLQSINNTDINRHLL